MATASVEEIVGGECYGYWRQDKGEPKRSEIDISADLRDSRNPNLTLVKVGKEVDSVSFSSPSSLYWNNNHLGHETSKIEIWT